ncbi:hypothetical protein HMPREF1617_04329 [Escherichia coli 908675]|nr:hypothetical protein HMPREF1617_04329 [Escherichia coli 908675]
MYGGRSVGLIRGASGIDARLSDAAERLIQPTESGAHQVPARLPDATRAFTRGF